MKLPSLPLVASLASALFLVGAPSEAAPLNCVAYEPFNSPNYGSNIDQALNSDLGSIAAQGFKCVKTYYSQHFGKNVAEYARKFGLQILLGVYMEDNSFIEAEISAATYSCQNHDNVVGIHIGNENVPRRNAQDILNIKNRLKGAGCSKPIGTTQMLSYYLNTGSLAWNLVNELDFLGYTVYPFFSPLNGKSSADSLRAQIQMLKNAHGGIFDKFYIAETGWPTDGGSSPQGNAANWWNAKTYADAFAGMICSGEINSKWVSYFIFFDPAYKTWAAAYERSFGLCYANGGPKWDISNLHCSGAVASPASTTTVKQCDANTQLSRNIDYFGNDISSVQSDTHLNCCGHCSNTYGCNTWVWTNYNGGTCFLKKAATSSTPLNSNLGAVAWTSTSGDQGSGSSSGAIYFRDTDFYGNDIGNVKKTVATDCFDACYQNNQCNAFTWTNYQGGTCWLKSTSTSGSHQAYAISGLKCRLKQDVDYPGNDIGSAASATASGCCKICATKDGCKAFTWSNYGGGTCWLKSGGGNGVSRSGLLSFSL